MADFSLANELAVLAAATWPRTTYFTTDTSGVVQPDYTQVPASMDTGKVDGVPGATTDGLALPGQTMACLIGIDMRENIAYRTARISIADFDASREYTIDIDGSGSVTTSSQPYADAFAALTEIKSEIDADAGLAAIVSTSVVDASGSGDYVLVLTGLGGTAGSADYSITDLSASAGTGVLDLVADASALDFDLYCMRGGVNSAANPQNTKWRKFPLPLGVTVVSVADYKGYEDRYDVAGLQRLRMEVSNLTGPSAEVTAGSTVNSVVYTYQAHAGICIENGDT